MEVGDGEADRSCPAPHPTINIPDNISTVVKHSARRTRNIRVPRIRSREFILGPTYSCLSPMSVPLTMLVPGWFSIGHPVFVAQPRMPHVIEIRGRRRIGIRHRQRWRSYGCAPINHEMCAGDEERPGRRQEESGVGDFPVCHSCSRNLRRQLSARTHRGRAISPEQSTAGELIIPRAGVRPSCSRARSRPPPPSTPRAC